MKDSDHIVPPFKEVPLFLKGLFMDGLAKEVLTTRDKIAKSVAAFDHYFYSDNDSTSIFNQDMINDLISSAPLVIAYQRKLLEINDIFDKFALSEFDDYREIDQIFDKMRFEELDVIVAMHREKRRMIDLQANLWSNSFATLRKGKRQNVRNLYGYNQVIDVI
jgi:cell fate (sporulation/competence/biofilm development) regulator YmcA (YheA/YmcA/DUF963 family)